MTPLQRSQGYMPMSREKYRREMAKLGHSRKAVDKTLRDLKNQEQFANEKYIVAVSRNIHNGFDLEMIELSVKRRDKEPIFDWREMQQMKNEIVGPECEGIQLFPAESRLVDTANQYWMYCFSDPKVRVPVGFSERRVEEDCGNTGSKQRKFS